MAANGSGNLTDDGDYFTLERSKITFLTDNSAKTRYGNTDSFFSDLLDIYERDENALKEDLQHNALMFSKGGETVRIRKSDFIQGIQNALQENPSDGLDNIVPSESICDDVASSEDDGHELKSCFERNFIQEPIAEKLVNQIIDNAFTKSKFSPSQTRRDFINELSKNYYVSSRGRNKTWKDFVEEKIEKCDRESSLEASPFFKSHSDSIDFLKCLTDEIRAEKENMYEPFYEHCNESFMSSYNYNDKEHLMKLSEESQVPFEILEHCANFGYDVLEKYRPISESQTFLESFGFDFIEGEKQS